MRVRDAEEDEGSGGSPLSLKGYRSSSPLVEIMEDQQGVEEEVELEYIPICRVRSLQGWVREGLKYFSIVVLQFFFSLIIFNQNL